MARVQKLTFDDPKIAEAVELAKKLSRSGLRRSLENLESLSADARRRCALQVAEQVQSEFDREDAPQKFGDTRCNQATRLFRLCNEIAEAAGGGL